MARPAVAAGPIVRRPGMLLAVGTLAGCGTGLALWAVLVGLTGTFGLDTLPRATTVLALAVTGSVLATRLPGHPVTRILCAAALVVAAAILAEEYARWGLGAEVRPGALPAAWLTGWLFAPLLGLLALFLPLVFPDGRLPSRRWRSVAWAAGGYVVLAAVGNAFADQPTGPTQLRNPYAVAVAQPLLAALRGVAAVLMVVAFAGAVAAVIVRFVRSRGEERQQLKWFASAAALLPLAVLAGVWSETAVQIAFLLAPPLIAVAIGIAVLRHRLYAIDIILNRTLVYAVLTALVALLYVGVVTVLGAVFGERSDLVRSLAATVLVAAVFQPLRARLQLAVDRLLYGDRATPYDAVARLGARLETAGAPEAALPGVVETVAQALRLPYAEIELRSGADWAPSASYGVAPPGEPVEFPLVHRGETIGRLLVAPRAPGEVLNPADRRLLTDLARQVSVAAHAVQLTANLQRSRAELVTAREEERRRLRRDLHDGLGPALAGVILGLDVARGCVREDPAATELLLGELKQETQRAVEDIRRVVYGLRPPALDELGACLALREHISRLTPAEGVAIRLECGEDTLVALPAAVEVALYRIAVEAITNVVRHARARTCVVRFDRTGDGIGVEVVDDGEGLPADLRAGVGTTAMRERAQELGGRVLLEPRPGGGTRLRAHLPLPPEVP